MSAGENSTSGPNTASTMSASIHGSLAETISASSRTPRSSRLSKLVSMTRRTLRSPYSRLSSRILGRRTRRCVSTMHGSR